MTGSQVRLVRTIPASPERVYRAWLDPDVILRCFAPGPNVLVISMIGWHMAGVTGMLAATVAIVLPSTMLALVSGRLMTRYAALEWIGPARKALAPIAVGLMLASGLVMMRASFEGILSLVIVAASAALVVLTKTSPFWGILAGALLGVFGHALHVFA